MRVLCRNPSRAAEGVCVCVSVHVRVRVSNTACACVYCVLARDPLFVCACVCVGGGSHEGIACSAQQALQRAERAHAAMAPGGASDAVARTIAAELRAVSAEVRAADARFDKSFGAAYRKALAQGGV